MKNVLLNFLKGFIVGASFRLPGISGGTIAIIIGCYNKLLHCLNNIFKEFRESFKFLAVFGVGALVAFFALNKLLIAVTDAIPAISAYFFVGLIIATFPTLFKESELKLRGTPPKKHTLNVLLFLIGAVLVVSLGILQNTVSFSALTGFGYYMFVLLAGFFGGIALVLPGISFMFFLMVLGIDANFAQAVDNFDFAFLLPFAGALLLGIIASAKVLYICINRYKTATYLVIMGFLLGSAVLLLSTQKYVPANGGEIGFCVLALFLGMALVFSITYLAARLTRKRLPNAETVLQ